MAIFIDIYESRSLNYNARRAIRRVSAATRPVISRLEINRFDWKNLETSSIILDEEGNVRPKSITYIVVHDENNGTSEQHHYYVIGHNYMGQQRWELALTRNAWYGVETSMPAYIERSDTIPNSILNYRAEKGLQLNPIKAQEIPIVDAFGAGSKWGILYLNKIQAVEGITKPIGVQLETINYNTVANNLPSSPDAEVEISPGVFLSYYNDFELLTQPSVPTSFDRAKTGASFTRRYVDPSSAGVIPSDLESRKNTVSTSSTLVGGVAIDFDRIVASYTQAQGVWYTLGIQQEYRIRSRIYSGTFRCMFNANGQQVIYNLGGAPTSLRDDTSGWSTNVSSQMSSWQSTVSERLGGRVAATIPLNSSGNIGESFPWTSDAWSNPPISSPPSFTTVSRISAGVYRPTSTGNAYNYTFNNNATRVETQQQWFDRTPTSWPITTNATWPRWFNKANVQGYWSHNTTVGYQIAQQGTRVYEWYSDRRLYNSFRHTGNQITLLGTATTTTVALENGNDQTFRDDIATRKSTAEFIGINTNTTTPTVTYTLSNYNPTAGGFQHQGIAERFTEGSVTYVNTPDRISEGFYRDGVGGAVYRVIPEAVTREVGGQFNYDISAPSWSTTSVSGGAYSVTAGTITGSSPVRVRLHQTHIGAPEQMVESIDCVLDPDIINNSIAHLEPYAVLCVPLFDLRYRLNGVTYAPKGTQTERIFYDFIRTYSGTGQVADAQIIPFAPEIFKTFRGVDQNGQYVDISAMNRVGVVSGDDPNSPLAGSTQLDSIPFVVIEDLNMSVEAYVNVNPYADRRKEYTCRRLRLVSPNSDGAFDFNYYEFQNGITNWGPAHNNADLRIDVNMTLKPYNFFMHACPYISENSLMGARDFKDFRGLICGSGLYQATMTSNAFETYKRQNVMYEQVQQRQVESLGIQHEVELAGDVVSGIMGGLQGTYYGAMAGSQVGGIWEDIFGGAGGIAGGVAGGVAAAAAYTAQGIMNERLRARERDDLDFYYEANLKNIKAQPDTLNRVSSLNTLVQRRFYIVLEQYACRSEEVEYYENHIRQYGHSVEIVNDLQQHLIHGSYIKGHIIESGLPPYIHRLLNEDLQRGVYFYEQV